MFFSMEMYLFGCETRHWEYSPSKKRRKNERKGLYSQFADCNTGVLYTKTYSPDYYLSSAGNPSNGTDTCPYGSDKHSRSADTCPYSSDNPPKGADIYP